MGCRTRPSRRDPGPPRTALDPLLAEEILLPLVIAFVVAMTIQATVAKPFEISTGSMNPTIMPSDRVLANRFIYHFRDVRRGDIVVFQPPRATGLRPYRSSSGWSGCRATRWRCRSGQVFVNGEPFFVEGAAVPRYYVRSGDGSRRTACSCWATIATTASTATCGASFRRASILGEVFMTYWPLGRLRIF